MVVVVRLAVAHGRAAAAEASAVVRAVPAELRRVRRLLHAVAGAAGERRRPARAAEIAVAAALAAHLVCELSRAGGGPHVGARDRPGAHVTRSRCSPVWRPTFSGTTVARIRRSAGRAHDASPRPPRPQPRAPAGVAVHARRGARRRAARPKPVPERPEVPDGRAHDPAADDHLSPDGHPATAASAIRSSSGEGRPRPVDGHDRRDDVSDDAEAESGAQRRVSRVLDLLRRRRPTVRASSSRPRTSWS